MLPHAIIYDTQLASYKDEKNCKYIKKCFSNIGLISLFILKESISWNEGTSFLSEVIKVHTCWIITIWYSNEECNDITVICNSNNEMSNGSAKWWNIIL